MSMLEVDGIHTYYGESHVLHGVSLRVGAGEAVVLLGRNGAGKTTLIRSVVGFTPPREGLLLDEPSEGLAPIVVREVGQTLQLLKRQQMSILLVEQNYHLALGVADRVYVMNKGQIVWEGTPVALESAEDVKRRYLGVA